MHYDFKESRCELVVLKNAFNEPMHVHDFDELVVISGGSAIHVIDDQEYPVVRGDVFVIRGEHYHTFKNSTNLDVSNVLFRRDYFEELEKDFADLPGFKALFIDEPRYRKNQKFKSKLRINSNQLLEVIHLLNAIRSEQDKTLPGFNKAKERILEFLIINICRYYSKEEKPHSKSLLRISKALDFMENNYEKHITNCFLARIACMSESNFRFSFKKITGLSPIGFLVKLRIEKAVEIMGATPNVNVTETSMKTGFEDSAYFSKKFKEIVGITPMTYLKKVRALEE